MNYTDDGLQIHELNFWLNSYKPPFFHLEFYKDFFDFSTLKNKKVLDVGCGGAPISEYCGVDDINLTMLDPLMSRLLLHEKYIHLNKYDHFSGSLFDFDKSNYEYVVCLNVIDHFNDPDYSFIDKFHSFLCKEGFLWLYYDVRHKNDGDHLMIDNEKLISRLESRFDIVKIDESINPTHSGWASVSKSIRIIAKKK
jgi:2-polyprenyl-3-methyl-5-hydroxy-6-metoxy-1,4-benzoquinol methylase